MADRHVCPTGRHPEPDVNCYNNHLVGCRCDGCRGRWRAYMAARVARRRRLSCPNCDGPGGIYRDGLCNACYTHRRRHGVDRPRVLYDPPPRVCSNCDTTMPAGKSLRKGRCEACARYMTRNGRERPMHLARAA